MRHNHDCEIYQLADLLKAMMRYEEDLDYDTRKQFGVFVDDLIDCIANVNEEVEGLRSECHEYYSRCEALEDEHYGDSEIIDDLRETHRTLIKTLDQCIIDMKVLYDD